MLHSGSIGATIMIPITLPASALNTALRAIDSFGYNRADTANSNDTYPGGKTGRIGPGTRGLLIRLAALSP